MITEFDAIILAGGKGSRLGLPSKPDLVVGGRRLLDIALAAVHAARRIVVVGPVDVPEGVAKALEDPPFGGPVAGVQAGFEAFVKHAPWTVLLASDLPGAEAGVATLLQYEPLADDEGVCLLDGDRRMQWLLGCYRTDVLGQRLTAQGDPPLTSLYRLLEPLQLVGLPAKEHVIDDIDTPEDAARWGSRAEGRS